MWRSRCIRGRCPIRCGRQFGWHIIKLEDRRNRPVPEFDKVRPQIETFLVRRGQTELIAQLREKAKIERLDKKGAPGRPQRSQPGRRAIDVQRALTATYGAVCAQGFAARKAIERRRVGHEHALAQRRHRAASRR